MAYKITRSLVYLQSGGSAFVYLNILTAVSNSKFYEVRGFYPQIAIQIQCCIF